MAKLQCKHWYDCGITGGGCCSIGEYNRPSFSVCLKTCTAYDGPPRTEEMKEKILKTVKGSGCCKEVVRRIRWLGVEWVGVPKPVRWWRWVFMHGHPHPGEDIMWPGCGCFGSWYDFREFWRAWKRHRYWKRRLKQRKLS